MANKLCTSSGGNTGRGKCDTVLGVPYGLIFASLGVRITPEMEADLLVELQNLAHADAEGDRIFPIIGIGNVTNEAEEPTMGTLASTGITRMLRPGVAIYLFEYETGLCIDAILSRFSDWKQGVYIVTQDPAKRLWGYGNNDGSLSPYPGKSVSVFGGGFDDGQNYTTTKVRINLGSDSEFKRRNGFLDFNASDDLDALVGLQTAHLYPGSVQNAIRVEDSCSKESLTNEYGTALAEPSAWLVTDAAETPVTPTNIAVTNGELLFTVPIAGKYTVEFAVPSAMKTAGLEGWQSDKAVITTVTP